MDKSLVSERREGRGRYRSAAHETSHASSGERRGTRGKWDSENAACPLLATAAFMSTCPTTRSLRRTRGELRRVRVHRSTPKHENMGAKSDALQLAAIVALFAAGLQYMRFLLACRAPRSSPVNAPLSAAAARTDLYAGAFPDTRTQHSASASASDCASVMTRARAV